jgi:16S rRNA (uracil1498-N3)-methyltransferase
MNRFFGDSIENSNFIISDKEQVNHISKILRLKIDDFVELVWESNEYLAQIISIDKYVVLKKIEDINIKRESKIRIALFQGIPKSDKMDLIIQKTTELGISRIVPLVTKRIVSSIKNDNKIERWNKIALEASKQSKRTYVPLVDAQMNLKELINLKETFDMILVPYENEESVSIQSALDEFTGDKIGIVIGPEGGFEKEEIEFLSGFCKIVTLGNRILRTETAAIATVSIVQYHLGDLK